MEIVPKLMGDLGQRYVVRQRLTDFIWRSAAWTNDRDEAEVLERHLRHDVGVLETAIVDRQPESV